MPQYDTNLPPADDSRMEMEDNTCRPPQVTPALLREPTSQPALASATQDDVELPGAGDEALNMTLQPPVVADGLTRTTLVRKMRQIDLTGCECGSEVLITQRRLIR
jgi:hypothetical protein